MQLDLRHLATTARFGAVGGKTTTPRIHSAADVAPFKGPASSQCPSGLVVLGAAGRAGSPARERASGGARRGARIGQPPRLSAGPGARSASAHVWRERRWPVEARGVSERGGTGAPVPGPSARLSAGPRRAPLSEHLLAAHLPRAPAARPPARRPRVRAGLRPGPAPRPPRAVPGARRSAAEVRAAEVEPGRAGPGRRGDDEQVPKVAVQTQGERCRADPLPSRDRLLRGAADTSPATRRLANTVALPSPRLERVPPLPRLVQTPPALTLEPGCIRCRACRLPVPAPRASQSGPACAQLAPRGGRHAARTDPPSYFWVPERPLQPPSLQRR